MLLKIPFNKINSFAWMTAKGKTFKINWFAGITSYKGKTF